MPQVLIVVALEVTAVVVVVVAQIPVEPVQAALVLRSSASTFEVLTWKKDLQSFLTKLLMV